MSKALRILVIDDMESASIDIEDRLRKIGVGAEIEFRRPVDRRRPFGGCKLPAGEELDSFDLALIDLELFPPEEPAEVTPEDLRGGSEFLPYLREHAPWIPAIGYSHLFGQRPEPFFSVACGFGFDGHATRGMLTSDGLTWGIWCQIFERACLLRKKAVLGHQFTGQSTNENLIIEPGLGEALSNWHAGWKALLCETFWFAKKIVVEPMKGGLSGAKTFHVTARPRDAHGVGESEWVWKVSKHVSKLHREARAHALMARSGLGFARMAPLLYQGVLAENGLACLTYQFAKETHDASTTIASGKIEPKSLMDRISTMLGSLYAGSESDRDLYGPLVGQRSGKKASLARIIPVLGACGWQELFRSLADNTSPTWGGYSVEYQKALIHGDLHFGNIMLGERDVLIDFGLSGIGPIAADVAMLATDLLLRLPELRDGSIPNWGSPECKLMSVLGPVAGSVRMGTGDALLYNTYLGVNLGRAYSFRDVDESTKAWIVSVLRSSDPPISRRVNP